MYAAFDHPDILSVIFHPRRVADSGQLGESAVDHLITVETYVEIGARFHIASSQAANLLFFHGNGEIVADYDDLGPLYNRMGINLLAADYRGYGRSDGTPTVSAMMSDCHKILEYTLRWLEQNHHNGPLVIMGRSLGSASAIELAAHHPDKFAGLIIESGFAFAAPLLQTLGISPSSYGIQEKDSFDNLPKIAQRNMPTLIIHAEYDHIIPYDEGKSLFKASPAEDKQLLKIDGANHNDIFVRGLNSYLQSVQSLVSRIASTER